MNRSLLWIAIFSLLFLFLVQSAGVLVESIYILDLMNTSLDEKAAGLLFFFSPAVLLAFGRRTPKALIWGAFAALFIGRSLIPHLDTVGRLLAAGVAVGAALVLLPLLLLEAGKDSKGLAAAASAQGLALAAGLSTLLRTINFSLDYSLEPSGARLGWFLAALLGLLLFLAQQADRSPQDEAPADRSISGKHRLAPPAVGIILILTLCYFAFFSPGVIARWTEGDYRWIVIAVSGMSLGWTFLIMWKPGLPASISPRLLLVWNLLFTLALTGLLFSHTVAFPATPESAAVVVAAPDWYHGLLLALTLLLFPVIFFDFARFAAAFNHTHNHKPLTPRQLANGFLLGAFILVLLVFFNIFSNVWGYVEPVSTPFRNMFWLPFFLIAGGLTILAALHKPVLKLQISTKPDYLFIPGIFLGMIFLSSVGAALLTDRSPEPLPGGSSLRLMTYNIQAGNDADAQRSYERQLALVRYVNPDILALQESDTARISLANNDYVRYFASMLGYYVYYGPKTVTGTFGTALLSKYPLENAQTIFTFSDQDEIGTTYAEIVVAGRRFAIFNVHPDGSDAAMLAFAQELLRRAAGIENVILLGDYNLREGEAAYELIAGVYKSAWLDVYPSGIDPDGLDMSGKKRIDHIFLSPHLLVSQPVYLPAPDSATDHPAHWADISWD